MSLRALVAALLAVAVLAALSPPQPSAAKEPRTVYVSVQGSDSGPGTEKRPFRTIARALASLRPGDTALVRAGTYTEPVTVRRSGKPSATISLRAYPGEQPVLTGQVKLTNRWFRLSGFLLRGGTAANPDDVPLYISGADDVWVTRNTITGSATSGIFVGDEGPDPSDRVRIIGNRIQGNGDDRSFDHGLYFGHGSEGLVANNVVSGNAAYGIQAYPDCDRALFVGNTIVGNGRAGIIVGGNDEIASERNRFVNNVVAFNREVGIVSYWEGPTGKGNSATANLAYGNPDGGIGGPALAVSRTVSGDPKFVSRARGDFHLLPASAAIDRALTEVGPKADFDGRRRPQGAESDLGAFERPSGH